MDNFCNVLFLQKVKFEEIKKNCLYYYIIIYSKKFFYIRIYINMYKHI